MINKKDTNSDKLDKEPQSQMPLLGGNFKLMAIAGAVIVIGFLLMAGGASGIETFNDDIFSARRVVVGPTIAFLGFIFMGFAIMYNPKKKQEK